MNILCYIRVEAVECDRIETLQPNIRWLDKVLFYVIMVDYCHKAECVSEGGDAMGISPKWGE